MDPTSRRHRLAIRRIASSLAPCPWERDDLEQDLWLRALERPPAGGSLGWYRRVARSLLRRRRWREEERPQRESVAASPLGTPDPAEIAERLESLARLSRLWAALDEPYRSTLYLRFVEDLSPKAIALKQNVSTDTVKTRLRRGLERLRDRTRSETPSSRKFLFPWFWLTSLNKPRGGFKPLLGLLGLAAMLPILVFIGADPPSDSPTPPRAISSLDRVSRRLFQDHPVESGSERREPIQAIMPPVRDDSLSLAFASAPAGFVKRPKSPGPPRSAPRGYGPSSHSSPRSELQSLLTPLFESTMRAESIPGAAVAVVEHGRLVFLRGFGVEDIETETPVDPETTVFRIGSVSKALTALAALVAVDQDRLDPSARLNDVLTNVDVASRFQQKPTLRDLLTHTGGFDQIGSERNFEDPNDRPSLAEFLNRDLVVLRPPGRETCYDTYGISLIGQILADVCESDYAAAMDELLFDPLDMHSSWVEVPKEHASRLATGYALVDGNLQEMAYEYYASTPASSIDATVADMARLIIAIVHGGEGPRLLESPDLLRANSFRAHPSFQGFTSGFWEEVYGPEVALQHGGTMRGYSSDLLMFPERGCGVYLALTRDGETGPPPSLAWRVEQALLSRWNLQTSAPTFENLEAIEFDAADFVGPYVSNLFCHSRAPGSGWSHGSSVEVRESSPGRLSFLGRDWRCVETDVFQDATNRHRTVFLRDARKHVVSLVESSRSPGTNYERIDDAKLRETFGESWRSLPATALHVLHYRLLQDWPSLAKACDLAAEESDPDPYALATTRFHSAYAWARLGDVDRTMARTEDGKLALDLFREDASSFDLVALEHRFARFEAEAALLISAAHANGGDGKEACRLLDSALNAHGGAAARRLMNWVDEGVFDPIRDLDEFRRLRPKVQRLAR